MKTVLKLTGLVLTTLIIVVMAVTTLNAKPTDFTLYSPAESSEDVDVWPLFEWGISTDVLGVTYSLQISTTPQFFEGTYVTYDGLTDTLFMPSVDLVMQTQYYWRVLAITSDNSDTTFNDEIDLPFNYFNFQTIPASEMRELLGSEPLPFNRTLIPENTPYTMRQGNLDIPLDKWLRVLGGVTLEIEGDYSIDVHGRLAMLGTEVDSVFVTSANATPVPGDWQHIKFYDESPSAEYLENWEFIEGSGSTLQYVNIQYAGPSDSWDVTYVIEAINTGIYVLGCNFLNCANDGIINIGYKSAIINSHITGHIRTETNYGDITDNFDGAGIYFNGDSCLIKNNKIQDCEINATTPNRYNRIQCRGVGIFAQGQYAQIENNTIENCKALISESGYTYNYSGYYSRVYGVGMYVSLSESAIINNILIGNKGEVFTHSTTAHAYGGGIYFDNGVGVLFTGNILNYDSVFVDGGASSFNSYRHAYGGGIYTNNIQTKLDRCTITNNFAGSTTYGNHHGSGIYNGKFITNSIIKYNVGDGIYGDADTISYCNISQNDTNIIKSNGDSTIAMNNWWFTRSDEVTIEEGIWDRDDTEGALGHVKYQPFLTDVSDSVPGIFQDAYTIQAMEDDTYLSPLTSIITDYDTVYFEMTGMDENPYSKDVAVFSIFNRRTWNEIRPYFEETENSSGVWRGKFYVTNLSSTVIPDSIAVLDGDTLDVKVERDTDVSFMIVINGEQFQLLSPDGGECFVGGSMETIEWRGVGGQSVDGIDLHYSDDNGTTWTEIVSGLTGVATYDWTLPVINSDQCLVRAAVNYTGGDQDIDESDTPFSIDSEAPSVAFTTDFTGMLASYGDVLDIEWTENDNLCGIECIFIEMSSDNGTNWEILDSCIGSLSPWLWAVPDGVVSDQCLMRITAYDYSDQLASDIGELFEITNLPVVAEFLINNGDAITTESIVTLNSIAQGAPLEYMASEDPAFTGASWLAYDTAPSFTLSAAEGVKTVYFKVQNASGESGIVSDNIEYVEKCLQFTENTGSNYSIIIDNIALSAGVFEIGDEIGVFDGDLCVGATVFDGSYPIAIVAWEDDSQTTEKDGYTFGNIISYVVTKNGTCDSISVCVDNSEYIAGDGTYGDGPYAQLGLDESTCCRSLDIPLSVGWNYISMNVLPESLEISDIFAGFWTEINIIKQCDGGFCVPNLICGVDPWNSQEAYSIHMKTAQNLQLCGLPAPCDEAIPLSSGWNCVSYLPEVCQPAEDAVASVASCLNIVKAPDGSFYIPGLINSMGDMCPLSGYQIHLTCASDLTYPCPPSALKYNANADSKYDASPIHFDNVKKTHDYYPIVFKIGEQFESGDEIGLFNSDGILLGSAVISSGMVPISLWYDDPQTAKVDGFVNGDKVSIKLWSRNNNCEVETNAEMIHGSFNTEVSQYAIFRLEKNGNELVPNQCKLLDNYPNPFNPSTSIEFDLPASTNTKLDVYNISGQHVVSLVDKKMEAGRHSIIWNGLNSSNELVASGIYFYRLKTDEYSDTKRMLLLK